ncbi:serine protease, partial [Streptomyces bambusae]|nr:serine protease [Streptomyces bambusae]
PADRDLLRLAARSLLARPADTPLHGSALAVLLRDPQERARHLPHAVECFRQGTSRLPAEALVEVLPTLEDARDVDRVFEALRARADGEVLRALAALTGPALARRAGDLVRERLAGHPEDAPHAAVFVDLRLEQGRAARGVVQPLVTGLLRGPAEVRAALAGVLAAPGGEDSRELRGELADVLLTAEEDPGVLDAVLGALAHGAGRCPEERTRQLLRRTGRLLLRTPGGPALFERRTVELARTEPPFGELLARWLAEDTAQAAALLGPGTRRMVAGRARRTVETPAGP